jgi:hypothetical protein
MRRAVLAIQAFRLAVGSDPNIEPFWCPGRVQRGIAHVPQIARFRTILPPNGDARGRFTVGGKTGNLASWSMIRKSGNRFSEKIMLKQRDQIMMRFRGNAS